MDKLTREEALKLHRQMWNDMQRDLGDCPGYHERIMYKREWCGTNEYFGVFDNCFLCEWIRQNKISCDGCPINWNFDGQNKRGNYCMYGTIDYGISPISEILALPESEVEVERVSGR